MKKNWFYFFRSLICGVMLALALTIPAHGQQSDDLRQAIVESCRTGQRVDVADYGVTKGELSDLFWQLYNSGELPWYTDRLYSYDYQPGSGIVTSFTPVLLDEESYDYILYEQTVAEILDAAVCEGMEPWQIALSIHDYLIANFSYDETMARHKGYDLLVRGIAVCDGYTEAYMDLMNRAGVPCVMVVSEDMSGIGHTWNLVQIDGNWYHVDVTWDDPTPNCQGRVSHDYFLKTDKEMASGDNPHTGWETDIACTDTRYSGGFWNGVYSQICYVDADTCFVRTEQDWDSHIQIRNQSGTTTLYTDQEEYINLGMGRYTYQHYGLSVWNGRVYFSTMGTVYSMEPDGSGLRAEYYYDAEGNGKYIAGCYVNQNILYLTLSDHDFNLTQEQVPVDAGAYHVHSYSPTQIPATCEEDGLVVYGCRCGVSYNGETLEATGHSFSGEGMVLKKATIFRKGLRRITCESCSYSYTEEIPKLTILQWLGWD